MKSLVLLLASSLLPGLVLAQPGSFDLLRSYGGGGTDQVYDLAGLRTPILAGAFSDSASVGASRVGSAGGTDALLVGLTPAGDVRWVRRIGGPLDDAARAVDAWFSPLLPGGPQAVYAGGTFTDRADYGGLNPLRARANNADIFLLQLNDDGGLGWIRAAGGAAGDDHLHALAVRPDGTFCAAGDFDTAATFQETEVVSNGRGDAWVACFAANGALQWIRTGGGPEHGDAWHGIAVGTLGEVYVTGAFRATATFGDRTLIARGGSEAMFARYSPGGTLDWVRQGGGLSDDAGAAAAFLPAGTMAPAEGGIVFTGTIGAQGGIFEPTTLLSEGGTDVFVARFTATGQPVWARSYGSIYDDAGRDVLADPARNALYLTGNTGTASFGTQTVFVRDSADAFVASLNPATGGTTGVLVGGGAAADAGAALALSWEGVTGYLNVVGRFRGDATFGAYAARASGAEPDVFLARVPLAAPVGADVTPVEAGIVLGVPLPQPARAEVRVRYTLEGTARARLRVVDLLGRTRVEAEAAAGAGPHELVLDTSALPAGLYVLRLESGGAVRTQPLVVAR